MKKIKTTNLKPDATKKAESKRRSKCKSTKKKKADKNNKPKTPNRNNKPKEIKNKEPRP